jgi:hypothetical protein
MPIKDPKLCAIVESEKEGKKFDAIFRDKNCPCSTKDKVECGRGEKIVSFGQAGANDFTKTKDEEAKELYLIRHKKNEQWDKPMTPGSLARYILWNKPTLKASIADYKKRFDL